MPPLNNPSSRNFKFVLYPEDPSHVSALSKLMEYDSFCYILHDRDVDEHGEVLKPHWHCVLMLKNPKCVDQLAATLGIPSNYVQVIDGSRLPVLRYLIHKDHPSKFQYTPDDVIGTPSGLSRFNAAIQVSDKTSESDAAVLILEFIDSNEFGITISQVCKWCIENDCYAVFRRGYLMYAQICREHNDSLVKSGIKIGYR